MRAERSRVSDAQRSGREDRVAQKYLRQFRDRSARRACQGHYVGDRTRERFQVGRKESIERRLACLDMESEFDRGLFEFGDAAGHHRRKTVGVRVALCGGEDSNGLDEPAERSASPVRPTVAPLGATCRRTRVRNSGNENRCLSM